MLIVIVSDCSVVLVLVVADLTVLEEGGVTVSPACTESKTKRLDEGGFEFNQ